VPSFGRYETLAPIASGGMATVYLARAVGAGGFERLVAIKAMHAGIANDADFVAMFLDEARVAARIRHPNVVGTVDVQEGPEGLFLVMEYVEGPSLSALMRAVGKAGGRVPLNVGLRVLIDALLGLHAAHEQTGPDGEPLHIIHRDVSPQNILVGVDGLAKITDFGVAHAEARLSSTRGGEMKGKLRYMSPQQVRTEVLDRRADVYAAAVVLWELLTGDRLFQGDNDGALLLSVLGGATRSPRQVDDTVPEPIDRACMLGLRLDVDERPATALAFAEALEGAAAEAGVVLATPRVVAAFVKEIHAHKELVVPPVAGGSAKTQAPLLATAASAPAPVREPARDADNDSRAASVVSALPPRHATNETRARVGIAVGIIGLVLGAVALGSRLHAAEPAPVAQSSLHRDELAPAPSPPSIPPATLPVAAEPPIPATPPPVVLPAATPVPSTAPAALSARAKAPGPSVVRPPPSRAPRADGATDWKPQGL